LNIVAGLITPTGGSITIDGHPPARANIAYLFQNYRETIFPWKRVVDNIAYPLSLAQVPRRVRRERATALLDTLDIKLPANAWPNQLSGGQQQLLVLARSLISEPDVMLFDEPFGGLDHEARLQMRNTLQAICARRRLNGPPLTVLFVTHDIDEALWLADVVVVLSSRPARVVQSIPVSFTRPRTPELLGDEEFFRLRSVALELFHKQLGS
jgi:NitT/TauT family transport system ATP-binding protein